MTPGSPTHFEIYGEDPAKLAEFYRQIFGWEIVQMPGIQYWRVHPAASEGPSLQGGLTFKAIHNFNGWLVFVNVPSVDETTAKIVNLGGGVVRPKTAVPRTAWVTICQDPAKNMFGIWQPDPTAFPMPEPD